jgi:hypothetical protein
MSARLSWEIFSRPLLSPTDADAIGAAAGMMTQLLFPQSAAAGKRKQLA